MVNVTLFSETKNFGWWLGVKKSSQEATSLKKRIIKNRLIFCRKYLDWTAEDWGPVIFSAVSPVFVWRKASMATMKYPKTSHVWCLYLPLYHKPNVRTHVAKFCCINLKVNLVQNSNKFNQQENTNQTSWIIYESI